MSALPLILIFAVMGWFLYSQRRQAQQHAALIGAVEVGDDIVTSAGIYGVIVGFDPDDESIMQLEVAEGIVLDIQRSTVQQVAVDAADADADDEADDDADVDDDEDAEDDADDLTGAD
jgi:preprotein translocase subunit YajC